MDASLVVDQLSLRFGGRQAVQDLSFYLNEGEIVSLIGPHGAGKTTVLNLITGLFRPDQGEIRLAGHSLVGMTPREIAQQGIGRTFQSSQPNSPQNAPEALRQALRQNSRLMLNLSVRENMMAALYPRSLPPHQATWAATPQPDASSIPDAGQLRAEAEARLAFFGAEWSGPRLDQPAYRLSNANRRRLELGRALATRPRMLLLDEPAAGMTPAESRDLAGLIEQIRDTFGCGILLVEHDLSIVARVSDHVIALDNGSKIAEGSFEAVTRAPEVIRSYLIYRHPRISAFV